MLVQSILNSKPDTKIATVSADALILDAAKILAERRIGAVIVSETGDTADGILSERDVVRALGQQGAGCLSLKVKDLMTKGLVTCGPETSVDKIAEDMTTGRFRHMPVMEGTRMIGLISIGDVVKARMDELSNEKAAMQDMIMGR